ncbi:uncharacterized protein FOBCDRAFT_280450 [Fusarium oxysporum Fo47]|uniref:Secreted LysM effector LysM C-terminal domain-containing protein n=2 Tax=Fusarium oxysporum TaxID=5507 RepID=A0A8H5EPV4_FUSOX|nr:uncharacterized protein FOBCDRAFT_280450 [Fusarium oxysporum Fo47]EWZ32247.1 hypothetical protein FOZG_13818 [Fusarium oxysporum Fo47]KAF5268084.1 hypothetical protein FOXYS1_1024 [Fusarium oxysporum]QKD60826.2 hypothetical protein FOBCDRAFT_280450 [Fusarium oxysporum Fo47]
MKFPIANSLAILAAVSKVSAWGITFYNNVDNCDVNDETEYQILEGNQGDCYTFGSSMPGVSCGHYIRGGVENKGCSGMFKATSVWTKENSNCKFYAYTDCRDYGTQRENGECLNTRELLVFNPDVDSWEYIASFRCASQVQRLGTNILLT